MRVHSIIRNGQAPAFESLRASISDFNAPKADPGPSTTVGPIKSMHCLIPYGGHSMNSSDNAGVHLTVLIYSVKHQAIVFRTGFLAGAHN